MASQPIANYFILGPSAADNLDSDWHGITPLDSAEAGTLFSLSAAPAIVMDKRIGLNPPFYSSGFINLKTAITQIGEGEAAPAAPAAPTPGWED
jgi:hypothetical protein